MTNKNKAKDAIIVAASRLFRLHGYYGVGLSEIIKESGTAKGSLYYYFPEGKEELAIAAINHTKEFVSENIREVIEGVEDPVQAIQTHIYQLSGEFSKESILGLPIGTIAGETALTNEPIRLACQSAFEDWQSLYIEKLIASGYSDKQSKDLALVINAMLEGGILLCLTKKSGEPLRTIAEQIPLLLKKEK
jgi:TetR/AcrR family transcriptional repressor of lmrAB and yxaGH operons